MSVIERKTKETDIKAELNVYGSSKAEIDSGIGFFDHMLTALTAVSYTHLTLPTKA